MKANDFSLPDQDGNIHTLSKEKSPHIILYFYPKDNTPGCTLEAQMIQQELGRLNKLGAKVFGISGGDQKSKQKMCEKNNLSFPLLTDDDYAVAKAYGVYKQKKFMGKTFMGISRESFVLDSGLTVVKHFEKVNPFSHAEELARFLEEMQDEKSK